MDTRLGCRWKIFTVAQVSDSFWCTKMSGDYSISYVTKAFFLLWQKLSFSNVEFSLQLAVGKYLPAGIFCLSKFRVVGRSENPGVPVAIRWAWFVPPGWNRVNWSFKIWVCHGTPGTPRDDRPVYEEKSWGWCTYLILDRIVTKVKNLLTYT